ncbi:hypothetical protein DERP_005167 [Dermatophagoides pteronyssinus]|uniref:Uncharacterized protein n=1 Tax=Dermatophagoides pteronyssinus TaxID=6956 RepID=A0ABQ8JM87_DERPT|nr:hypothetical protein DERP_005167 [Dermatophagoides pteronyssinus]
MFNQPNQSREMQKKGCPTTLSSILRPSIRKSVGRRCSVVQTLSSNDEHRKCRFLIMNSIQSINQIR